MAKVSVTINGITGEVEEGTTLLKAAEEIGVGLAHLCFGNAFCSTCRVNVVSGDKALSEQEVKERVSLDYHLCFDDNTRLACQAKVKGPDPVVVNAPKFFRAIAPRAQKKANPQAQK